MFKAVKGDPIDELWCYHLNKAQLNLPVKRLSQGKYIFGTRNIMAKIINGKLVIRVGGGYMSADEFIEQYGQIELVKMMKAQGEDITGMSTASAAVRGRGSVGRSSNASGGAIGMGEMKDLMRQSLNIKTYENDATNKKGTFEDAKQKGSPRQSMKLDTLEG